MKIQTHVRPVNLIALNILVELYLHRDATFTTYNKKKKIIEQIVDMTDSKAGEIELLFPIILDITRRRSKRWCNQLDN